MPGADTPAAGPAPRQPESKKKEKAELSEEDLQKKEQLQLLVDKVSDPEEGVAKLALETIRSEIRSATSSMTSIPKPLKFMRAHFDHLKTVFDTYPNNENKKLLADILSVLAMTMPNSEGLSLKYKLSGTRQALDLWGHEYVRNLTAEIRDEYLRRTEAKEDVADLMAVVAEIAPFHMLHHAEPDAVDLLLEIEQLDQLVPLADDRNYKRVRFGWKLLVRSRMGFYLPQMMAFGYRVCRYLLQCSTYSAEPDDAACLRVARTIYLKHRAYSEAMITSLRLGDSDLVREVYDQCDDEIEKRQLAFILARHGVVLPSAQGDDEDIMRNAKLSEYFLTLAADLDVLEPKLPEDVYKTHLDPQPTGGSQVDAGRNLAASFVNAFVNAGFGRDKLLLEDSKASWIHLHRDHGMTSATAALGMLLLWDVEAGLTHLNKYMYVDNERIRAGAFMGMGLVSCNVRNAADPAMALLGEPLGEPATPASVRIGCIVGLGLAYVGTGREEVLELLRPIVEDADTGLDTVAHACLALGLVFTGTAHGEVTQTLLTVLMERAGPAAELNSLTRFVCLGLGLLFLGRGESAAEATLLALEAVPGVLGRYASLTVESCAAAFSGDVLKVQKMLGVCADYLQELHTKQQAEVAAREAEASGLPPAPAPSAPGDAAAAGKPAAAAAAAAASGAAGAAEEKKDESPGELYSAVHVAVLGIALVASGEDIGSEMAQRAFGHLLQYGDHAVRRAVPLALGLISISNPQLAITDLLSKLSHDADGETALSAIFALGLIGAGTNNARIAGLLRQLALYYQREPQHLFVTRLAQGLLHLGKGTLSLAPAHSERFLMQPSALAGLLVVLHAGFDMKNLLLGRAHYLLFHIAAALHPRMLMTVDTQLKPLPVPVRVGQAVDTVGQAGHPKSITGFQTHTAPVLLSHGERAELATSEYLPVSPVLEGLVILKKNPDYKPPK